MRHSILLLLGMAAMLAGCGGGTPKPTELRGGILVSAELNPNSAGQPSPTVLRIYELTDNRKFLSAEFFELYDDDSAFLGGDFLGRTEIVVEPGTDLPYDRDVSADTKFVGVVAAFRDVETATWRDSVEVKSSRRARLRITLEARSVRIDKL